MGLNMKYEMGFYNSLRYGWQVYLRTEIKVILRRCLLFDDLYINQSLTINLQMNSLIECALSDWI
jgi:hypothetical protein